MARGSRDGFGGAAPVERAEGVLGNPGPSRLEHRAKADRARRFAVGAGRFRADRGEEAPTNRDRGETGCRSAGSAAGGSTGWPEERADRRGDPEAAEAR